MNPAAPFDTRPVPTDPRGMWIDPVVLGQLTRPRTAWALGDELRDFLHTAQAAVHVAHSRMYAVVSRLEQAGHVTGRVDRGTRTAERTPAGRRYYEEWKISPSHPAHVVKTETVLTLVFADELARGEGSRPGSPGPQGGHPEATASRLYLEATPLERLFRARRDRHRAIDARFAASAASLRGRGRGSPSRTRPSG